MTDIVITVASDKWPAWLRDHGPGDGVGRRHSFRVYGDRPPVSAGDQLFIAACERIRCAFDIEYLREAGEGWWIVVAVMARLVTVHARVQGFSGWKRRWWHPAEELQFPEWRSCGIAGFVEPCPALAHGKTPSLQGGASA